MPDPSSPASPPTIFFENGSWQFEIELVSPAHTIRARSEIKLDQSMRVVPTQHDTTPMEWSVGLQGVQPTIGVKFTVGAKGMQVSPDQRAVTVSLASGSKRVGQTVRVPFRFVSAILPRRIVIEVSSRGIGGSLGRATYEGVYLGSASSIAGNLVDFLKDPRNRFFFGRQGTTPRVVYDALSTVIPAAQRLPGSIVWGTTWPHELDFWNSPPGIDFLARQNIDLVDGRGTPRRIAICPFSLEVKPELAYRFLAELEVQRRLGVDIRVLEPTRMTDDLDGTADALLCLGDRFGVMYSGILAPQGQGTTAQLLFGDDVDNARKLYNASQLGGRPFAEYLSSYPRPRSLDAYVTNRLDTVRARIQDLRRRELGIPSY